MTTRILLVDDDTTLLKFMADYLEGEAFEVITADRGQGALRKFYQVRPDIVVLDVMMPGMDGWEVCARLRELADIPVIMLTAKTSEADKLRGFRLGVDDYVTKPFSLAELTARIHAVVARAGSQRDGEASLVVSDLVIDLRKREVSLAGKSLELTPTEFRLLAALAERAGEAVSKEELTANVWGKNRSSSGSVLRRYIWLLRKKIEKDPSDPRRLITMRGYGYRLED
ncbi:MAG: response regulator transcription factor [Anaerolineales bacterium]|jgi:two-component system KDP operon response regulator KdpE